MMSIRTVPYVVCLLACLLLGACAAEQKSVGMAQAPAAIQEMQQLYAQATTAPQPRRTVRKPVRDAQARAMRQLAAKSATLLAQTENWPYDTRLTGVDDSQRQAVSQAVDHFRSSLQDLHAAARIADRSSLRSSYAGVMVSYRQLMATTDELD